MHIIYLKFTFPSSAQKSAKHVQTTMIRTYYNILEEKTIADKQPWRWFAQVSAFCSVSYNYMYLAKQQLHYIVYLYNYVWVVSPTSTIKRTLFHTDDFREVPHRQFSEKNKIKHVKKYTLSINCTHNFSTIIFENAFAIVYECTMSDFKDKEKILGKC